MTKKSLACVCFILMLFLSISIGSASANPKKFPEGFILHYNQIMRTNGVLTSEKLFVYEVLGWAPSAGDDVIKINKSIELYDNSTNYIVIPSWDLVDENGTSTGSYMTSPLWVDLEGWEDSGTIDLPVGSSHASTYDIAANKDLETPYDNFTCWRASFSDYASGWNVYKTIYYENSMGIQVRSTVQMVYSGGSYSSEVTYELNYSNMDSFHSSLPFGLSMDIVLIGAGAIILLVIVVVIMRRR